MSDNIKEQGAASMIITLHDGIITVAHGGDGDILAEWVANTGDWARIWDTINTLEAVGGELI